jgi:hypothetical protein
MPSEAEKNLIRRRLLGRGLTCAPVGALARDLVLQVNQNGRIDFGMVEGVDNLGQALSIAVTTPLRGDLFNTDFGFDGLNALAEETVPVLQRERIRVAIIGLLRKDPRVSRVVDIKLIDGRLEQPGTGAARTLEVRVAFETASGDQITLNAGIHGTRFDHG